jgi:hypothetical protein
MEKFTQRDLSPKREIASQLALAMTFAPTYPNVQFKTIPFGDTL